MAVNKFVYEEGDFIEVEAIELSRNRKGIRVIQYRMVPAGRRIAEILECENHDIKWAFRKYGIHKRRITKGRELVG